MKLEKQIIIILIIIIAIISAAMVYEMAAQKHVDNNANNSTNKTRELNATLENTNQVSSESGKYGYCAVCGKALTYAEASNDYTQGKVCYDCAHNPYYQSGEGAQYANKKLQEAYPTDYEGMFEDSYSDNNYYENEYDEY